MFARSCTGVGRAIALRGTASRILLVLGCLVGPGCSSSPGPPRLVLPEVPLELGEGLTGEELTGTFPLKNEGGQPLHIEELKASCGCAVLGLAQDTIAPGVEVPLRVAVRLREGGGLLFAIHIHSNDPASPTSVYHVRTAVAQPTVRTEPAQISFGELALGTSPSQRVQLLKRDGSPWPASEPVSLESARGLIHGQIVKPDARSAAESLLVEVQPRADLPVGSFEDTLTITPQGSQRALSVPVLGHVMPRIVATPSGLYFGNVDPGSEPLKRYVQLRRTDGQPLPQLARSTAPTGMQVEDLESAGPPASQTMRRLLVTLQPASVTEDIKDGNIVLWLANEPEPVTVRVLVFLERKTVRATP